MSSPYPRDDFDAVTPPRDGRRGAHRAAPRRSSGVLAPLVIAAVVAVAGGAGYVAFSTAGGGSSASASTQGEAAAADAAAAQDGALDDASADADAAASSGASSADPAASASSSSASSTSTSTSEVDRTAAVVVLNGTGTKGLAATKASTLTADGWKVSSTGNATSAQRSAHQGTTVLYPTADLEASAKALATSLGGTATRDSTATARTLTVLLLS